MDSNNQVHVTVKYCIKLHRKINVSSTADIQLIKELDEIIETQYLLWSHQWQRAGGRTDIMTCWENNSKSTYLGKGSETNLLTEITVESLEFYGCSIFMVIVGSPHQQIYILDGK